MLALGTAIGRAACVCVNCAAPIALGLQPGVMRLETTLAALLGGRVRPPRKKNPPQDFCWGGGNTLSSNMMLRGCCLSYPGGD